MSKKRKKKGVESLEAQSRAHEALYGEGSREVAEYRRQALEIVEKYGLSPNSDKISEEEIKIFKKRLKEFEERKRRMKNELVFCKVLRLVGEGEQIDTENKNELRNQQLLEKAGYIKNGKLTGKGKELLKKLEG